MSLHYPKFADTESSIEILEECKKKTLSAVEEQMLTIKEMNYSLPMIHFPSVEVEPQIFTNLGESRLNCLSNLKDFQTNTKIESSVIPTSHPSKIVAVLNIDNERIASGSDDGRIHI